MDLKYFVVSHCLLLEGHTDDVMVFFALFILVLLYHRLGIVTQSEGCRKLTRMYMYGDLI